VQTKRLAASFELLTGFIALTVPEKFPRKAMCNLVVLAWDFPISAGHDRGRSKSKRFTPKQPDRTCLW